MDFAGVCIAVLLVASLSLILKVFGFKGAPVFCALAFCALLSSFVNKMNSAFTLFSDFSSVADISVYTEACIKVIGIGYLAGISGDVCREIGEGGAAKFINVFAKLELIAICAPFIKELFESVITLVGG